MLSSANGRHRRPRQTPAAVVTVAATGAGIALPLLGTGVGAAHATGTSTWENVAICETGGQWDHHGHNGFYGGLNISLTDWVLYGGLRYADRPDQASRAGQIAVAEKILATLGPDAWRSCAIGTGLLDDDGTSATDDGASGNASDDDGQGHGKSDRHHGDSDDNADHSDDDGQGGQGDDEGATSDSGSSTADQGDGTGETADPADTAGDPADDSTPEDPTDSSGATDTPAATGTTPTDPAATTPTDPADSTDPADTSTTPTDGTGTTPTGPTTTPTAGGGRHARPYSPTDEALAAADRATRTLTTAITEGTPADAGKDSATDTTGTSDTASHKAASTYKVGEGDSLSAIAADQDLSGGWRELYDANQQVIGDDPNLIKPGQILELG